jgi:hypothetical protein
MRFVAGVMEHRMTATHDPTSTATEMAKSAGRALQDDAGALKHVAQATASRQIERQKGAASEIIGDVASAVRRAGEELGHNQRQTPARLASQASDGLDSLARTLASKGPEEIVDTARDFAHRNPVAFAGICAVSGFALARFLRSSSEPQGAPESPRPAKGLDGAGPDLELQP